MTRWLAGGVPAALLSVAVASTHLSADPPAAAPPGGIQWFATWDAGKAEAARTGKPIMLLSAAPHCGGVPGIW